VVHATAFPVVEENLALNFSYTVTDGDGDTAGGSLRVNVNDDTPTSTLLVIPSTVLDDEAQSEFTPANPGIGLVGDASPDVNTVSGGAGTLFSMGSDGLAAIAVTPPAISVIYKDAQGFAQVESVAWGAGVRSADGTTTWTATSANYPAGTPAAVLVIKADGSYSFSMGAPLAHSIAFPVVEEDELLSFGFTVTDGDGDTAGGTLGIRVDDDTPISGNVTPSTILDDEGQSEFTPVNLGGSGDAPGAVNTVSGGAGTLFSMGSDGLAAITVALPAFSVVYKDANGFAQTEAVIWGAGVRSADGTTTWTATSANYPAGTPAAVLVIKADGSYSFSMGAPLAHATSGANEENPNLDFNYTVTDGDGDQAGARLRIQVDDDTPVSMGVVTASTVLDDDIFGGNANGTGDVADASTASGGAGALFSAGADGVSSVTLNSVTGFQAIRVVSGVASAENVVWGSPTISAGGVTTWIATGALSGDTVARLIINADGSYSFTTFKSLVHSVNGSNEEELSITFSYTVRDGDNDAANGSLIVNVDDDTPVSSGVVQSAGVYENEINGLGTQQGISDHEADNPDGSLHDENYTGNLNALVSMGADGRGGYQVEMTDLAPELLSLTSAGVAITYSIDTANNMLIGKANGVEIFHFQVDPNTGQYSFRLSGPLDHFGGNNASITLDMSSAVTARDGDGDTLALSGQLLITVKDDVLVVGAVESGEVTENAVLLPLSNGSFEADSMLAGQPGVNIDPVRGNYAFIDPQGWDVTGFAGVYSPTAAIIAPAGHAGGNVVFLDNGATLTRNTGITLTEGASYELTFNVGNRTDQGFGGGTVRLVTADGDVIATLTLPTPPDGGWTLVTLNSGPIAAAFAGEQLRIEILHANGGQALIDNVQLYTIPPTADSGSLGINWGADNDLALRSVEFAPALHNMGSPFTSHGDAITYQLSNGGTLLTARASDGRTVFTLELDKNGSGTWTYKQFDALDHDELNGRGEDLSMSFGFVATDADDDTATGSISIRVNDDTPVLAGPVTSGLTLNEDDLSGGNDDAAPKEPLSATGNLAIDLGIDSENASVSLSAMGATWNAGTQTLTANDGAWRIVLNGDGTYTFFLVDNTLLHGLANNGENTLSIDVTYRATDGDLDDDLTGVFTVNIVDDVPVLGTAGTASVSENGLPFVQFDAEPLAISWGADNTGVSIDFAVDPVTGDPLHPAGLTSDGVSLSYELRTTLGGEKQLVAFKSTETIDQPVFIVALSSPANPTYVFTLWQNLDHNVGDGSSLALGFTVVATDGDGDQVQQNFTVNVADEIPTIGATGDQTLAEATASGFSNAFVPQSLTNVALNVDWGADDNNPDTGTADRSIFFLPSLHHSVPAGLESNGFEIRYELSNDGQMLRAYRFEGGSYITDNGGVWVGSTPPASALIFEVTLSDDGTGSYSFTLHNNLDHTSGDGTSLPLNFGFNVTDSDGDNAASNGSFTVNVTDNTPALTGPAASVTVSDADLPSIVLTNQSGSLAIDWNADDGAAKTIRFNGNPAGLSSDGVPLAYDVTVDAQGNHVMVAYKTGDLSMAPVFIVAFTEGNPTYTFTLFQNLDHAVGTDTRAISFSVRATDGDGDFVDQTFIVNVGDDVASVGAAPALAVVDEDVRIASPGNVATASGDFTFDFGNDDAAVLTVDPAPAFTGVASLSSGGEPISFGFIGGVLVGYVGVGTPASVTDARVVLSVELSAAGSGSYTFTLRQPLDHAGSPAGAPITLTFDVTGTDGDGDPADTSFAIQIDPAGSISSINYASLQTGVFVNLADVSTTVGAQTVAANTATDNDNDAAATNIVGNDNVAGIVEAIGGSGDDILVGGAEANTLTGNDGADILDGGAGSDLLQGGAGNDTFILREDVAFTGTRQIQLGDGTQRNVSLTNLAGTGDISQGGADFDTINLERGSRNGYIHDTLNAPSYLNSIEKIVGTSGDDFIVTAANYMSGAANGGINLEGGAGNDHLGGGAGEDLINGGADNDVISGLGGNDTLNGDAGNDEIWGGAGNDAINGGDDDDTLIGGSGSDALNGGAGDDTIIYNPGNGAGIVGDGSDTIDGGEGDEALGDTLKINRLTAEQNRYYVAGTGAGFNVTVDHYGIGTPDTLTVQNVENLDVELKGHEQLNLIGNLAGVNVDVQGNSEGQSVVLFQLATAGAVTGDLGAGDDEVWGGSHATGAVIEGGDGVDTLKYGMAIGPITADLAAGTVARPGLTTDLMTGFENVEGTTSGDTLRGSSAANILSGGGGADTLVGRGGNDNLQGGDGIDTVDYSQDGGAGSVFVNLHSASVSRTNLVGQFATQASNTARDTHGSTDSLSGVERFVGTAGADVMIGSANADIFVGGDGRDLLEGQGGNDELYGEAGDDTLQGQTGEDKLYGGAGNDLLEGGNDNDLLDGGDDNDTLIGGGGADTIFGGAGDDTIRWTMNAGSDIVDGGTEGPNGDTFELIGDGTNQIITITAADNDANPLNGVQDPISIAIDQDGNGSTDATVSLTEIEEIVFNLGGGNDQVIVNAQSFAGTSLDVSTITLDMGAGNDTLDLHTLQASNHRVVANGGADTGDSVILGQEGTTNGYSTDDILSFEEIIEGGNLIGVKLTFSTNAGDVTHEFRNFENFEFTDGSFTLNEVVETPPAGEIWVYDTNGDFVAGYTELRSAIDNATTLSGYTLKMGAGNFVHTGLLNVNKSVTIEGSDLGMTNILRAGANPNGGTEERTVEVNAANVTFRDLHFSGWQTGTHTGNAGRGYLVWNNADGTTFDNVGFHSDNIRVALYIGTADNITVTESEFTGYLYRYAIRGAGENMEFTNNEFNTSHYQSGPIYMEYGAPTSGVISGNTFNHGYGVTVLSADASGEFQGDGSLAYTITNWQPHRITADGLRIEDNEFNFVSGNNPNNVTGAYPQSTAIFSDPAVGASGPVIIADNSFDGYGYEGPIVLPVSAAGRDAGAGTALSLDGTEAYGSFVLPVDIGQQGTMSVWVQLDNLGKRNQILEGPGNGGLEFQYRTNGGGQFYGSTNGGNSDNYAIMNGGAGGFAGGWTNVQYVWDFQGGVGGYMRIYVNGTEVTYLSANYDALLQNWTSALNTAGGTFYLGRDPGDGTRMLDGRIDELAIFSSALTPAQLAAVRTNAAGVNTSTYASLVAFWNFDAITGTTVASQGGTNVDLKLHSTKDDVGAVIVINGGSGHTTQIIGNAFDVADPHLVVVGNERIGGTSGNDTLDGGQGIDLLDLSRGTAGVNFTLVQSASDTTFDFSGAGLGVDDYRNFEGVIGTDFADVLTGSAGNDIIVGGKGDDILSGAAGNDVFVHYVGDGNDSVDGGTETGTANPNYDIVRIVGDAEARTYAIGKTSGGSEISPAADLADVLVTYTGTNAGSIRADEVERVEVIGGSGAITVNVGDTSGTAILPTTIVVTGGSGNDVVDLTDWAGDTHVIFNGNGGSDRVIFDADWADVEVVAGPGGSYSITLNGRTIDISNVENIQFDDVTVPPSGLIGSAPADITTAGLSVAENSANGASVGSVSGVDADAQDELTYAFVVGGNPSLTSADGRFAINAATGAITVANGTLLDFETAQSHNVVVRVTDSRGLSYDETLTVGVTDVVENVAPETQAGSGSGSEDNIIAVTLNGTDVDGNLAGFRIKSLPANGTLHLAANGSDAALTDEQIVSGTSPLTIYFKPAANWNGTTSFDYAARDAAGAEDATPATATITVASVNDNPFINNLGTDTVAFTEGGAPIQIDKDNNALVGDVDTPPFAHANAALTVRVSLNAVAGEDVLSIAQVGGITIAGNVVSFNGTAVGTVSGGTNGANLVFDPNASADSAAMQAIVRALRYENTNLDNPSTATRTIQVSLHDGIALRQVNAFVEVQGVNDAPTVSGVQNATVNEGVSGALIDTFTVSDVDTASGLTFRVLDGGGTVDSRFEVVAASGTTFGQPGTYELRLKAGQSFDFFTENSDGNPTVTRSIEVKDGTILVTSPITVTVAFVNDAPVLVTAAAVALGFENATGGDFPDWTELGTAGTGAGSVALNSVHQTEGSFSARLVAGGSIEAGTIQTALGMSSGALDAAVGGGAVHFGSAIYRSIALAAGQTFTFDWRFDSAETFSGALNGGFNDFAYFSVNGSVQVLRQATEGDSTGWATGSYTALTAGTYTFGFGVMNVGDNTANSQLYLDNVDLSGAVSVPLAAVAEDAGAPANGTAVGTLVSALIDLPGGGGNNNVTDADTGAVTGIALTATNTANGTWWYSLDNGASWSLVGAVSNSAALLLKADAGTRLYFQAAANFNGSVADAITYRAWDQTSGSAGNKVDTASGGGTTAFSTATATSGITVTPVNDAPTFTSAATASVAEGATAVMTVTSTDVDGGTPTYSIVTTAGTDHALFAINSSSGALSFTSARDFETPTDVGANNIYEVDVQVSDGNGGTSVQRISVTVTDVAENVAPNTQAGSGSGAEDTIIAVTLNGTDADSNLTGFRIKSLPANGTLHLASNGGDAALTDEQVITGASPLTIYFKPAANWNGTTTFDYAARDGAGAEDATPATATVTVSASNDNPVANADTLLLGGMPSGSGWTQNPANGHWYKVVGGNYSWATGKTAAEAEATGAYLATVTSASENAFIQTIRGGVQYGWIGASDSAVEGTWRWVTGPESGTLVSFTNWNGNEPNNFGGDEDYAEMTFVFGGGWNDASGATQPSPSDWTGYVAEWSPNEGVSEDVVTTFSRQMLLANDTDAEGNTLSVTSVATTSANGATISYDAGTGVITYNPTSAATIQALAAGATLNDTFTYTISDGNGGTATGTATIVVKGVSDAPTPQADIVLTNWAGSQFDVPEWAFLLNDTDPNNAPLDITGFSNANSLDSLGRAAGIGTNGFIRIDDNFSTAPGGSFSYAASNGTSTTNANVALQQDTGGAVDGDADSEILVGNDNGDTFHGNGGNDIFLGGGGDDTLNGSTGNDTYGFDLADNSDTINDTNGTDRIYVMSVGAELSTLNFTDNANSSNDGNLVINVGSTTVTVTDHFDGSNEQVETITFLGGASYRGHELGANAYTLSTDDNGQREAVAGVNTILVGDSNNATLIGNTGNDLLFGTSANNTLNGGDGNDLLVGNGGTDTLNGDGGDDTLIAATNSATLNAGTGADTVILVASTTAASWTVNLGNDTAADKVVFDHASVSPSPTTAATVSNFKVAEDKIAVLFNGNNIANGGFVTVSAFNATIAAGTEVIEVTAPASTTSSLGDDGDTSTIENILSNLSIDSIAAGTYTVIIYSSTLASADAGIYSVTFSATTNPSFSGMIVEHIMTLNGVGHGALGSGNFAQAIDPIVLDLNGDGYAFSGLNDGVSFDINGDGAADKVAWNNSGDGILAFDLNGDGVINDGTELFTPDFAGGSFANGGAALASLDTNGDGMIDELDTAFASLAIWTDGNADGVSDAGELRSLADHGITSISAPSTPASGIIDGQEIIGEGSFTRADGSTGGYVEVALEVDFGRILMGTDGDDVLVGGAGLNVMTGGGGNDTFVIDAGALGELDMVDVITDFSAGDTLDLSGMIDSFLGPDATLQDAQSVVTTSVSGNDTTVFVDAGSGPEAVVTLQNYTAPVINILYDQGEQSNNVA